MTVDGRQDYACTVCGGRDHTRPQCPDQGRVAARRVDAVVRMMRHDGIVYHSRVLARLDAATAILPGDARAGYAELVGALEVWPISWAPGHARSVSRIAKRLREKLEAVEQAVAS